ncbi:MAG: DUF47 family protein [Eggerthellaceae bacterium]|nr:DUF47 family protein [Eggerthellaceae bacterium]
MAKQKHDYFSAFAQQIELAVKEAELLIDTIENFTTAEAVREVMDVAHDIEAQADEVAHSNYNAIAVDFITPLDRDDIINLTHAIDTVVDRIEGVIQSFYMTDVHHIPESAVVLAQLIKEGCQALQEAIGPFSTFKSNDAFRVAIMKANECEEKADQIYIDAIRDLHTKECDNPVRLLVWSRILSSLESCCDAFERAADLMGSIFLKNA